MSKTQFSTNLTQSSTNTKGIWHLIQKYIYRKDLVKLCSLYGSAKWDGYHLFAQHYQKHFSPFRLKKIKLLEIGVGGYDNPNAGGESLKVWKQYFPNGMIYGIDIMDKKALEEERIKIFQGDQNDEQFLKKVIEETGELDIIIEDGCSVNEQRIKTFKTLFPALKEGGIYVEENTHISYFPSLGSKWSNLAENNFLLSSCVNVGGSLDLNASDTIMAMYKRLADGLNYVEFLNPGYRPSYFDKNIVSIHFYHNLVFVYKGNNNESSNVIENNTLRPDLLEELGVKSLEDLGLKFPSMESIKE